MEQIIVYGAIGHFLLGASTCALCCYVLKSWFFDNTLDAGPAIGMIAGVTMLTSLLWQMKNLVVMLIAAIIYAGAIFALPFLMRRNEREGRRRLCDADIEKYINALQFDPNNASAHAMLAAKYAETGRIDEAMFEYQRAIELNPRSPSVGKWRRTLRNLSESPVSR